MASRLRREDWSRRGYTIVEIMVAVAIMAVLAALALPSISNALMEQRIKGATQEVLHLIDFARVQATSRNRAYELAVDQSARKITVNESANTRCDGFDAGVKSVRELDFVAGLPTGDLQHVTISGLAPAGFGTSFSLCFKPDGRVLRSDTGKPVASSDAGYAAGEARIVLQQRSREGTATGIRRQVVIPYNGIPVLVTGG